MHKPNRRPGDGIRPEGFAALTGKAEQAWPNPDAERCWALVRKVAASSHFRRSGRLRDFLLYVCERALRGDLESTREQQIGYRVFGRPAGYNPAEDNIVRVEARQLRKRLASYFASDEGSGEPIVITIPKGSYAPLFQPRQPADAASGVSAQASETAGELPAEARKRPLVWSALIVSVAALGCIWLWSRHSEGTVAGVGGESLAFPWSAVFERNRETQVVLPDSSLNMVQDLMRQRVTLAEYANRSHLQRLRSLATDAATKASFDLVSSRRYTSFGAASLIQKVFLHASGFQDRIQVNQACNMNIRNFKTDNVVLIGSAYSNPWLELFEPKLNFRIDHNPVTQKTVVRNRSPRAKEAAVYTADSGTAYTTIALLPNLTETGSVLIVAGSNVEGTEAGGDLLADAGTMATLCTKLGLKPGERPRYFELLLRSRALDGAAKDTEPIGFRLAVH